MKSAGGSREKEGGVKILERRRRSEGNLNLDSSKEKEKSELIKSNSQVSTTAQMSGKSKAEYFQSDREAFLNAFEKPTQIYRYIRNRTLQSPIFLHRNLSYMKERNSRGVGSRRDFDLSGMLGRAVAKLEGANRSKGGGGKEKNYFNIILQGLSDPDNNWLPDTKAKVELQIARICLKKRKEVRIPILKAFEGSCELSLNSNKDSKISVPVISVPSDCFNLVNGHVVRSYVLLVRITIPKCQLDRRNSNEFSTKIAEIKVEKSDKSEKNEENNVRLRNVSRKSASLLGGSTWSSLNPQVVIKPVEHVTRSGGNSNIVSSDDEPKAKRRRSAPVRDREEFIYSGVGSSDDVVFMGQITIYDKQLSISLGSADYELLLRQTQRRRASFSLNKLISQEASWEILDSNHPKIQMFPSSNFPNGSSSGRAKLNIAIRTSPLKSPPFIDPPPPVSSSYPSRVSKGGSSVENNSKNDESDGESKKMRRVIYQFLYNNNSRQQTEAREDLRCPWCSLNCLTLYSLLKHLKLCHPRFNFTYVPLSSGSRIDVSLNEGYDGSYSGSAFDLVAQPPGEAFARNGPTKRTSIFSILVCRPLPEPQLLDEFLESEEKDVDVRKTFITGHNRLYHHTTTCLPIGPKEIDVDSEGEADPEWLQIKTSMMIDEFTDVNEGEKELMKMWNLHVLKNNYVGDCQIPLACEKFVEFRGKDILGRNLYRNFILHLTNLSDFGLLSPQNMYYVLSLLHAQMRRNVSTVATLRDFWTAHMSPEGRNVSSGSSSANKIKNTNLGVHVHITTAPTSSKNIIKNSTAVKPSTSTTPTTITIE